jgi:hypothetical protein
MARKAKAKISSWKDIKKDSFRKQTTIEIDDERSLIFKSLNPVREKKLLHRIISIVEAPVKERKATKEEKEEFKKNNPSVNPVIASELKIKYIDYSDKDYQKKLREDDGWMNLAADLINIDLTQKVGDVELWKDMELEDAEDYIGLAKFLFEFVGFDDNFLKKVKLAKNHIKGDLVSNKLIDIENYFKDVDNEFDLMEIITKHMQEDAKKKEAESKVVEDETAES